MLKYFCCLLFLFVSVLDPLCVFADQVTLKNGDHLTGKILNQDSDIITLETAKASVIKISAARVDKVSLTDDKTVAAKADAANRTLKTVPVVADNTLSKSGKTPTSSIKPVPKLFGGDRFLGLADN